MLIEVKGLSVVLNGNNILQDINIHVSRGEFVSIVGPNGSGKTTLLKAVMSIVPSSSTLLKLDGKNISAMSRRSIAKIAGYLPQMRSGMPEIKVMDLLLFSRFPYKDFLEPYDQNDRDIVMAALVQLDCASLAERKLGTLSGGEIQRVMIASSLAQETEVILLDEPTAFLDPNHRSETFEILGGIRDNTGKALVLVTHFVDYALNFSSRIIGLKEGRVAFDGKPEAFVREGMAGRLFGSDVKIIEYEGSYIIHPGRRRHK